MKMCESGREATPTAALLVLFLSSSFFISLLKSFSRPATLLTNVHTFAIFVSPIQSCPIDPIPLNCFFTLSYSLSLSVTYSIEKHKQASAFSPIGFVLLKSTLVTLTNTLALTKDRHCSIVRKQNKMRKRCRNLERERGKEGESSEICCSKKCSSIVFVQLTKHYI